MLDRIISFSLHNRTFVVAVAALLLVLGGYTLTRLPIDVLPDLNRPRVTVFLESGGLSPEEVETQVVFPVETALNGLPGVEVVRSSATIGIGMVFVEFDWSQDPYRARQLVAEKLSTVSLPEGIRPVMGPISSIMGQIMMVAVSSDTTPASTLRTLSDFTIRRRLLSIKGVSQVIPIGGDRLQYQVLVSNERLRQYGLTIEEVDRALSQANENTTGGFFNRYGAEVLVRNVGRAYSLEDLAKTVVANREGLPVLLSQVAEMRYGAAIKRGDGSYNGRPAVILTVEKQPGANTVEITQAVERSLAELAPSLPKDVRMDAKVFQQRGFIDNAVSNVEEALRDGFILVVLVLFLFLLNLRTTVITLTAIPLSLVITAIIFRVFDLSINTLTLGGLAIAIGELVDDAIVDVENVFRRLKENARLDKPRSVLRVVYEASAEVRNSIVYATIIVVLVFLPLFFMQGIEGRIFAPLGVAYITSILASLAVSLTVTPALCSFLLKKVGAKEHKDGALVRWLKRQDERILHITLGKPKPILWISGLLIAGALAMVPFFGTEFLPPFNEGSFTINLSLPPGTSIEESNRLGTLAERIMLEVPEVRSVSRRTGRAELDEHVEPVSNSEMDVMLKEGTERKSSEIVADIRGRLNVMQGVTVNVGQPISHRLDHLLSGVRAQVAIKIFGNELTQLRTKAQEVADIVGGVEGATDVQIERLVQVPILTVKINRDALQRHGVQSGQVATVLQTLLNGKVSSQILLGQQSFDVLLRAQDVERTSIEAVENTQIPTSSGGMVPLRLLADVRYETGQNTIAHENTQRRIVVSANVQARDLGSTVEDMQRRIASEVKLSEGYYITYGGQFESQKEATRLLGLLSIFSLGGIFLVLYMHFRSGLIAAQVMLNIPLALIGSVAAVALSGGTFSIATLVGFITLTGIASRNGIMMISHYIHLIEHEGEKFSKEMIIRGSLERLVPVLMTALVAALALVPLTLDPEAPGKEILHPVAVVILGGLLSSTLLDILVTPVVFYAFGEKALSDYFKKPDADDDF